MQGVCEGTRTFDPQGFVPQEVRCLIKLRNTQLTPGFSGAPLLNLRTKKVCGMLKRTRDPAAAGGYAVRAALLLAVPEVARAQRVLETPLRAQLRDYLQDLADDCAKLPSYFPFRLQGFDQIRQRVRTITDRAAFYVQAQERERLRAAGLAAERYDPFRSRPEEKDLNRRSGPNEPLVETLDWEKARADDRFRKLAVLGDPGFGKSWLLRYEARHRALSCLEELKEKHPDELRVPILARLQDLARHSAVTLQDALDLARKSRGDSDRTRGGGWRGARSGWGLCRCTC